MVSAASPLPDRFDTLLAQARPLILKQEHQRDSVPVEGGRWPVGVVLRPDAAMADSLAAVVREVVLWAGPHHFRTGAENCAHVTVRALEGYRAMIADDDDAIERYRAAVREAASGCEPITIKVTGVIVTSASVMACATPTDETADRFAEALAQCLGSDGWYEADFARDIWYISLLHFTGQIADPPALMAWVDRNRRRELGTTRMCATQLVRFQHEHTPERTLMRPVVINEYPLAGRPHHDPPGEGLAIRAARA